MTMMDALIAVSTVAYFTGGLVGWLISFAARNSRRYYPTLSLTGTGIGVLPTYLLLLRVLRWIGVVPDHTDVWQLLMLSLVCTTITATGIAAFVFVLRSNDTERQERRARVEAGC